MNAWLISDIHVESRRSWDLPSGSNRPDFDVHIVAGDLHIPVRLSVLLKMATRGAPEYMRRIFGDIYGGA